MLKIAVPFLMLALAALAASACSNSSSEKTTGTPVNVAIQSFAFQPASLSAQPGDKLQITVKNNDTTTHTFTIEALSVDHELKAGEQATFTIDAKSQGSFTYHCRIHSSMIGTLQVGAGGPVSTAPAGGGYGY
ncbi:MAG TPA: cupredoxin domain-containing protein [Dehalococcoidia bacterium]|nr:cupredoxin domain-containing protein [Dehalococcoidia bacterium]